MGNKTFSKPFFHPCKDGIDGIGGAHNTCWKYSNAAVIIDTFDNYVKITNYSDTYIMTWY